MGPKRKVEQDLTGPTPKKPRNTVSLRLDDSEGFHLRYSDCQAHLYYWMLCCSQFRVRYGDRLLFTTPLRGTFYYVLRYKSRHVTFVIDARTAWLIGFCTNKGFFQVQSREIDGLYMDSAHTKLLRFNGNHNSISPSGTGSSILNIYDIRRLFDVLSDYTGPSHRADPPELASFFGSAVVFLMEAKAWKIFMSHYNVIQGFTDAVLGAWVKRVVNNWIAVSRQTLNSVEDRDFAPHDCGIIEHVDGCLTGMFEHEKMEPEPRKLTWDPIDEGIGDGDIVVPRETGPRFSCPSTSAMLRKRVTPDTSESIEERRRKKPKGLVGGGLGGESAAPEVFTQWMEAHIDKKRCTDLFDHLKSMGLTVLHSKRPPGNWPLRRLGDPEAEQRADSLRKEGPNENANEKGDSMKKEESDKKANEKADPLRKEESNAMENEIGGLNPIDIASLEAHQFISDGVVNFMIMQYSNELLGKGIHDIIIAHPDVSFALSDGDTTGALQLCSNLLVIFPINMNEGLNNAGGATHWTVLVLDKCTKYGPRFVHYDSLGGVNLPFARHLANMLNSFVPPGTSFFEDTTHSQLNPFDCGLYIIAVIRSICRWHGSSAIILKDWSHNLQSEVSEKAIAKLRRSLYNGLRKHKQKDASNA